MATLSRTVKAKKWSGIELASNNIIFVDQSPQDFFGVYAQQSLDHMDPLLLDSAVDATNVPDDIYKYLGHLDLAAFGSEVSFAVQFFMMTLYLLGVVERNTLLSLYHFVPLAASGNSHAQTVDICLFNLELSAILFIIKVVKNNSQMHPEADIVAGAIAAYQYNNENRQARRIPTLDAMTIPCVTVVGTRPVFYLVPVTRALDTAVRTGQHPTTQTEVVKCITPFTMRTNRPIPGGMDIPEYRRLVFQRFIAFKNLAKEHWNTFLFE
jgi:hypothetical protein